MRKIFSLCIIAILMLCSCRKSDTAFQANTITTGSLENNTRITTSMESEETNPSVHNTEAPFFVKDEEYESFKSIVETTGSGAFCRTEEGYLLAVSNKSQILKLIHTSEDYKTDDFSGKKHHIEIYRYSDNETIFSFEYNIGDYLHAESEPEFIDVNLDGNLDIRILIHLNVYADMYYANYLWNEENNTFDEVAQLNDLPNPLIDVQKKELTSFTSSLSHSIFQVHQFDGNEIIFVASVEYQLVDVAGLIWTESIIVIDNGEKLEYHRQITDEESNIVFSREMAYRQLLEKMNDL